MMKIKFLAILITALIAANSSQAAEVYNKDSNKLDLYGKIVGQYYFSHNKGTQADRTYARLGFRGETRISSQLTGFGRWESQFDANTTESQGRMRTRLGFVGLRFADFGSVDFGRNRGVTQEVSAWADKLSEFGGGTYGSDNFMQNRISNVLTYRNKNFFGLVDGLNFALQYQGKINDSDVLRQNGEGYAMSVTYNIGSTGVSIGGAFSHSMRTAAQNVGAILGRGDQAKVYVAGIKYDANNLYLGAHYKRTYSATRFGNARRTAYGFANKADNFELVAQYVFDSGLVPSVGYLQSTGHNIEGYGKENLVKYFTVGATYNFNKNMSAYLAYKLNLLKENKFIKDSRTGTDSIVAVALTYQF